ncbi:MAG: hypothetical protein E6767_18905 [Dysgonomonas sp.]|nr:hypothetical protein [Dysgonomonas sp.]
MKKFIVIALVGLVSFLSIDTIAGTGVTPLIVEKVNCVSGDDLATLVAIAPLAAVAANPEGAKQKLWCITQGEFDELQAQYKHLYIIDVAFDENEKYQFIARRPTKNLIDSMAANKGNANKITELMINNLIVAGDKEALEDGVVYAKVLESLNAISRSGKSLFTKA